MKIAFVSKTFTLAPLLGCRKKNIPGGSHGHSNNVCYLSLQVCVLLKPENTNSSSLSKKNAGDISELVCV